MVYSSTRTTRQTPYPKSASETSATRTRTLVSCTLCYPRDVLSRHDLGITRSYQDGRHRHTGASRQTVAWATTAAGEGSPVPPRPRWWVINGRDNISEQERNKKRTDARRSLGRRANRMLIYAVTAHLSSTGRQQWRSWKVGVQCGLDKPAAPNSKEPYDTGEKFGRPKKNSRTESCACILWCYGTIRWKTNKVINAR